MFTVAPSVVTNCLKSSIITQRRFRKTKTTVRVNKQEKVGNTLSQKTDLMIELDLLL